MTRNQIINWLKYWDAAQCVNFSEIQCVEDVHNARKFCAVMRQGVFLNITDEQIWDALKGLVNHE